MAFKISRVQRLSVVIGISLGFFVAEISGKQNVEPYLRRFANMALYSWLLYAFSSLDSGCLSLCMLNQHLPTSQAAN